MKKQHLQIAADQPRSRRKAYPALHARPVYVDTSLAQSMISPEEIYDLHTL